MSADSCFIKGTHGYVVIIYKRKEAGSKNTKVLDPERKFSLMDSDLKVKCTNEKEMKTERVN